MGIRLPLYLLTPYLSTTFTIFPPLSVRLDPSAAMRGLEPRSIDSIMEGDCMSGSRDKLVGFSHGANNRQHSKFIIPEFPHGLFLRDKLVENGQPVVFSRNHWSCSCRCFPRRDEPSIPAARISTDLRISQHSEQGVHICQLYSTPGKNHDVFSRRDPLLGEHGT